MSSFDDGWHRSDADRAFDRLQSETTLRDCIIASESGKEWKVHKLVLYMHSDVLYRMATSSEFIECQTGRAVLRDAEDRCVKAMVGYLYTTVIEVPNLEELPHTPSVDEVPSFLTTEFIKNLTTFYAGA